MPDLSDYFSEESNWHGHPKLRIWTESLHRPGVTGAKCELDRPRAGLIFEPAKICLHLYNGSGAEVECDCEDWDDDLNAGLIQLEIPAVSQENEKERFALVLRTAMRKPLNRFGDGYFNSVVVNLIREGPFGSHPEVAEVLKVLSTPAPRPDPRSYSECVEMINLAIRGRAQELVKYLHYPRTVAEDILAGAIAGYLDERFSVTGRRILGVV